MDKYEKVKEISKKLENIKYYNKNLYFRKDYNGDSGKRGKSYGSNLPFASWIISSVMLEKSWKDEYFPDPVIIKNTNTTKNSSDFSILLNGSSR